MKAFGVCVVLALTTLAGFAQSALDSEKARIVALENAWNEAEKNKDGKAIDGLLAPSFSYTDSDGSFMNKQQYLASITEAGYRPDQIVNDSMEVHPYEHAAVVTGTYREKGAEKGKAYSRRGRFTDMWVQEKGRWLCAASHETLIGK
ncbi:MAG: nuclear transport factor 2 family protein [Candidatus Sulfotelmatobacter sp.]